MKDFKIPNFLEDVFGEKQSVLSLLLIIAFAFIVTIFLAKAYSHEFDNLSNWKIILAILLIFDISAGCIANFSRGTSAYYASRSKNRWWFIAIHFHIVILALAFGNSLGPSSITWFYTISCASLVNFIFKNPNQKLVAGFCLGVGLILILSLSWQSNILQAMATLFLVKVVYSFGVNHYLD